MFANFFISIITISFTDDIQQQQVRVDRINRGADSNHGLDKDTIHLVVASCGSLRLQETVVAIKSALMFTSRPISLYLFTEQFNYNTFMLSVNFILK